MSPIAFLLIAVVVAAVGSLVVVLRSRQVQSPDHAMDAFRREMRALAPQDPPAPQGPPAERTRIPFRPADPHDRDE